MPESSARKSSTGFIKLLAFIGVGTLLVYGPFVWLYYRAMDGSHDAMVEEAEKYAEGGRAPKTAFYRAISIAPDCEYQDSADSCTLQGKAFLHAFLAERPDAKTELCQMVDGADPANSKAWALSRCSDLGHEGEGCCRLAIQYLVGVCM